MVSNWYSNDVKDESRHKVLIVNDSPMLTAILNAILDTDPKYEVVGTAMDGNQALRFFHDNQAMKTRPDFVLMDIHMPNMGGVTATQEINRRWPKARILIVTATVTANMSYIFAALNAGALDYVQTPILACKPGTNVSVQQLQEGGARLFHKLNSLSRLELQAPQRSIEARLGERSYKTVRKLPPVSPALNKASKIIAIGCSTGGPTTLIKVLRRLREKPSCPIIICQHIEPGFSGDFAKWLESQCGIATLLGKGGLQLEAGSLYLAPAGVNTGVTTGGRLTLSGPTEGQYFTPNIDILFASLAEHYRQNALGIVLTGMGSDGAKGAKSLLNNGGAVFTQDSETALIESMPQRTREAIGVHTGYRPNQLAAMMEDWMEGVYRGAVY